MKNDNPVKFSDYFSTLTDPIVVGRTDHRLIDIVTIAICGIICGADSWPDIEMYGRSKHEWFKEFLELPNGIPTQHTF
jgi:hypothetical protein